MKNIDKKINEWGDKINKNTRKFIYVFLLAAFLFCIDFLIFEYFQSKLKNPNLLVVNGFIISYALLIVSGIVLVIVTLEIDPLVIF